MACNLSRNIWNKTKAQWRNWETLNAGSNPACATQQSIKIIKMEIIKTEIKKASIKDESLEAKMEVEFRGKDEQGNSVETIDDVTRKSPQVLHADLKEAFRRLRLHMVIVCEQPEAGDIEAEGIDNFSSDNLENYEVTGYTISGSDESEGVVLTGKKLLKSGMVLNINTPFTKYEDEENYAYGSDLSADILACNYEVKAHLNGKWGIVQQEFNFDPPNEAETPEMKVVKETEEAA